MHRSLLLAVSIGVVSNGCTGGSNASVEPMVSDSAGVRFVTYPPGDAQEFTLGAAPRLQIRGDEDGGLPLFSVVGGAIQPGGDILIADGGNYRLLRWSDEGRMLSRTGREGAGPGEFQDIRWIQRSGSEIAVYDSRAGRISWFTGEAVFVRSRQLERGRPTPRTDDGIAAAGGPFGLVGTSEVLAYPMAFADPVGEAGPLPMYGDLHVYDSTGATVHDFGRVMLLELYEDPSLEGFPLANRMEAPRIHWAGSRDVIAIAHATLPRIDIAEGGVRKSVIVESRPRLAFNPDSIPSSFHLAADSLPAYRDVRLDGVGRVWVQPAVVEGDAATRWRIFSTDGGRAGDLTLPSDATVLDATDDALLLLRRSVFDEESIEVWDFRAPG